LLMRSKTGPIPTKMPPTAASVAIVVTIEAQGGSVCGRGGPNMQISGPLKYSRQISCEPKSRIPPKPIDKIPSTKYTFFKGTKMGCDPDQPIEPVADKHS
jgi:hypothetical protein